VGWGLRLVFYPDVADQAAAAVVRAHEHELGRRVREQQRQQLAEAIAAGEDPKGAGVRLKIHPQRLMRLLDELEQAKAG
jgi:hypothetical protein